MTTDHQMAMMYAAQQEVIVGLTEVDEVDLADRLERCMTARHERRGGDGWPYSCRSAACVWCRRPMIRSWWNGMRHWSAEAATSSLAIIQLHSLVGVPDAVRRLRRALRDVRDRMARRRNRWREVCFAGVAGGDHRAIVLVSHEGIDRREVQDVLGRRWPEVVVKTLEQEQPVVAMTAENAVDLGRCRRGIEPLRIVVMPQQDRQATTSPVMEPMPVVV
jgi:hypothetical protein